MVGHEVFRKINRYKILFINKKKTGILLIAIYPIVRFVPSRWRLNTFVFEDPGKRAEPLKIAHLSPQKHTASELDR